MRYSYRPQGVCSQRMDIETENGIITHAEIIGGCSGNGQGLARLVEGMQVDTAIEKLSGIRCGFKSTSCPDQFSKALRIMKEQEKKNA